MHSMKSTCMEPLYNGQIYMSQPPLQLLSPKHLRGTRQICELQHNRVATDLCDTLSMCATNTLPRILEMMRAILNLHGQHRKRGGSTAFGKCPCSFRTGPEWARHHLSLALKRTPTLLPRFEDATLSTDIFLHPIA